MNEDQLKQLLDEQNKRTPDPQAKQRAIAAAVAEFKAQHAEVHSDKTSTKEKNSTTSQGLFSWLRLTSSSKHEDRSTAMNTPNLLQQRWFLGGVATACIAFFGVMLAMYHPAFNPPQTTADETFAYKLPEITKNSDKSNAAELMDGNTAPVPQRAGAGPGTKKLESLERELALEDSAVSAEYATAPPPAPSVAGAIHARSAPLKTQTLAESKVAGYESDDRLQPPGYQEEGRDRFENFETNPIKRTAEEPVSTFSIDVDTASYSFVRRELNRGVLPQKDAVRLEEMVNYFDYQYPLPDSRSEPFSRNVTVIDSPWNEKKKLIHIGIKGYEIKEQPKSNLVFLLDVSGSMNSPDKLPLVKQSMNLLLSKLRPDDTVAIAVYAGAAGTVLEPTEVKEKQNIINAINALRPGGSTAGAQGIKLAYELAESSFKKDAVNRIILATDGDFNVGITNTDELKGFVERKREKGIYLSVLGFGAGNYHDKLMQDLAQNGNGIAAYIDTLSEAQKVLVNEATSNLFPIAKDVKIQVEFNPSTVSEYRLLGYETRALKREDFNNDAIDAGEIGAGHTVTAIYEVTPVGSGAELIDESRYAAKKAEATKSDEYAFLKIRYKLPEEKQSKLLTTPITKQEEKIDALQRREANFATAVAGFAQLLKDSRYTGDWSFDDAIALAQANKGEDEYGYRTEFVQLVRKAKIAQDM